jgi:CRP-like cAMP-binding protein
MTQVNHQPFLSILARQPLFRGLGEDELAVLAGGTRELRVKRHEMLFHKGDVPEGLFVVVLGQVKLFIPSSQGWEKVVHMEGPGATFGEAVVFMDKPYPISAQANQDSLLLVVSRDALTQAIASSVALCRMMLSSLSVRMHELLSDIEACTLRSSAQRVICYLMQYAPKDMLSYEITLEANKQTIAAQLNLAPETLSRVLAQLSNAGLIQVNGRSVTVLDLTRLRAFNP